MKTPRDSLPACLTTENKHLGVYNRVQVVGVRSRIAELLAVKVLRESRKLGEERTGVSGACFGRTLWNAFILLSAVAACSGVAREGFAQVPYDRPPIDYEQAPVHDAVTRLQQQLDAGTVKLSYDPDNGYLTSLLEALEISPTSQVLVFSKTSFQQSKISPRRPRAIYYSDHAYVGWVQRGEALEISTVDAQQGAIYYTLSQEAAEQPRFLRQTDNCLVCHASSHTEGIPGHFVRSVYPDRSGRPVLSAGTFRTDYRSPLVERWGGWYVSGTHGAQRHMGNVTVQDKNRPELLDVEAGANIIDLSQLVVQLEPYLTPHSDIVALTVLEHQVVMHNALAAANYSGRITARDARIMHEALGEDPDSESDSTRRRYTAAAEKVLDALLMVDDQRLTDAIAGTSGFADEFQRRGPFDSRGRSLRALDLKTRLFAFPCSYLIYSESFDTLPAPVRTRVLRGLWEVLIGENTADKYAHILPEQRQAILQILQQTKPNLPDYWHATDSDH